MDINPYEAPRSSGLERSAPASWMIHPFMRHFIPLAIIMLAIVVCGANLWLPYYYALKITDFSILGKPIVAIVGFVFCRGIVQWMFAAVLVLDLVCIAIGLSFDQMQGWLLPRDSIIWMLPIQLFLTAGIVWPSLLVAAQISKRESTARAGKPASRRAVTRRSNGGQVLPEENDVNRAASDRRVTARRLAAAQSCQYAKRQGRMRKSVRVESPTDNQ